MKLKRSLNCKKRRSKEEEKMNKTLDTKERSRARKVELDNKTKKTKKSTALDELKTKREEKLQKIEEEKKKEEVIDEKNDAEHKKKWKTNDIYSSDSSDDDIDKKSQIKISRKTSLKFQFILVFTQLIFRFLKIQVKIRVSETQSRKNNNKRAIREGKTNQTQTGKILSSSNFWQDRNWLLCKNWYWSA